MACLGRSFRDSFQSVGWPHMADIEQASGYLRTNGQFYDDGLIDAEAMCNQMTSIVVAPISGLQSGVSCGAPAFRRFSAPWACADSVPGAVTGI